MRRPTQKDTPITSASLAVLLGIAIALVVAAAVVHVVPAAGQGERLLRTAGGLLQLLGVGYVAFGLFRRADKYKLSVTWAKVKEELRYIFGRRAVQLCAEGGAVASGGASLHAGWNLQGVGSQTLEERVEALERFRTEARKHLDEVRNGLEQERADRTSAVAAERTEREAADREMTMTVQAMEVGSIHLEWAGVFWIILGLILSTWAPELAGGLPLWLHLS
jgi:hypothetical protein